MGWTKYQGVIALTMMCTGAINTITAKWSDRCKAVGREGGDPKPFHHSFVQLGGMFMGEFLCMFAFIIMFRVLKARGDGSEDINHITRGNRKFNPFALLVPGLFDTCATGINYVALNLTYASSYQMFRGSAIIFTALLTIAFFKRRPAWKQWVGIFLVISGLTIIGVSDHISHDTDTAYDKTDVIIGDCMVLVACFLLSCQNIYEEKFIRELDIPPLEAVGWEGTFGLAVTILLCIIFFFIKAKPPFTEKEGDRLEDAHDAFVQLGNNWQLCISFVIMIISCAFFNFSGITILKELSSVTRMVLDTVRTAIIYVFSLAIFGQGFHYLQPIGFLVLITGVGLYNEITINSFKEMCQKTKPPDDDAAGEQSAGRKSKLKDGK